MMQHRIHIVKDVPLCYRTVRVADAELLQRPVGDVLAPIAAVFVVDVEGEALACCTGADEMKICYRRDSKGQKRLLRTWARENYGEILRLSWEKGDLITRDIHNHAVQVKEAASERSIEHATDFRRVKRG